jgi:hypothetical protein
MRARLFLAVVACTLVLTVVSAQPKYPNGLFVWTAQGPVELITYAERTSRGTLKLQAGSLEDVPTIRPHPTFRILVNIPLWVPAYLMVSSDEILVDDEAETRRMQFASRRINVYAIELRVSDLEQPAKMAKLFRDVRVTENNPGLVFIALGSQGMVRYYPIRLSFDEPKDDAPHVHREDPLIPTIP